MSQNKTKIKIDQQLEYLDHYNYQENNMDPDSLSELLMKNLESYINRVGLDNFKEQYISLIDSVASTGKSSFLVATVGYNSGGSAGIIPRSIIIKQDKNLFKCYNMSNFEASFYEFHQLKDNIYLSFATIPGWGACMNTGIYIFDFDDLSKSEVFSICNADLTYDPKNKLLSMEVQDVNSLNQNDFKEGTKIFIDKDNDTAIITTQFDGNKFVAPQNNE